MSSSSASFILWAEKKENRTEQKLREREDEVVSYVGYVINALDVVHESQRSAHNLLVLCVCLNRALLK